MSKTEDLNIIFRPEFDENGQCLVVVRERQMPTINLMSTDIFGEEENLQLFASKFCSECSVGNMTSDLGELEVTDKPLRFFCCMSKLDYKKLRACDTDYDEEDNFEVPEDNWFGDVPSEEMEELYRIASEHSTSNTQTSKLIIDPEYFRDLDADIFKGWRPEDGRDNSIVIPGEWESVDVNGYDFEDIGHREQDSLPLSRVIRFCRSRGVNIIENLNNDELYIFGNGQELTMFRRRVCATCKAIPVDGLTLPDINNEEFVGFNCLPGNDDDEDDQIRNCDLI